MAARESVLEVTFLKVTKTGQMKRSAPEPGLPITAVLPPVLAERIRRHYDVLYGERFTASDVFAQFLSEFTTDARFRDRVQAKGRELQPIVFDSQNPSWGLWPIDPEECAAIGFLLGLSLEESIADCLANLPERKVVSLEEQVAGCGRSLEQIFIEMLIESKSSAVDPADWWQPGDR
jgi:hypothetical protein